MNKFTPELVKEILEEYYIPTGNFITNTVLNRNRLERLADALNSYLFKFQMNDVKDDNEI